MNMKKHDFSLTMKLQMPKVKTDMTETMKKLAITEVLNIGVREGSEVVQKSLKGSLNKSMKSLWIYRDETRDIIDTGKLMRSLVISKEVSGPRTVFNITYNRPYAGLIYYGGYITPYGNKNAADVFIPGRPWVQAIMEGSYGQEKIDIEGSMKRAINKAWKGRFGKSARGRVK